MLNANRIPDIQYVEREVCEEGDGGKGHCGGQVLVMHRRYGQLLHLPRQQNP